MKDILYIVIDESGATHQKENDYFVIAGYMTKRIYAVKSTHKQTERELKNQFPYLNQYSELKGCFLHASQKALFLNRLFHIPTTIPLAIIIDKNHLFQRKQHDENIKYNYFLQLLLNHLLHHYPNLMVECEIQLILDNRNVRVGSLYSLQDYLNSALGLVYDKKFCVVYKNSREHREVQMADFVANVLFGYYNYPSHYSAYYLVPKMKKMILSKFPYKNFQEPDFPLEIVFKKIDKNQKV